MIGSRKSQRPLRLKEDGSACAAINMVMTTLAKKVASRKASYGDLRIADLEELFGTETEMKRLHLTDLPQLLGIFVSLLKSP
jgi:hypothetical protein